MELFVFVSEQWLLVSVLLGLLFIYVWREKQKGGKTISCHEMTRLVNDGAAVLLDIREAKDYKAGHIVDSINIPAASMEKRVVELDKYKDKVVVIICKMGQTAGAVGKQLGERGFTVQRLGGGMMEWQSQNLPVVKK